MTDTPTGPETTKPRKRSLIDLLTALPQQVQELVQREIDLVKAELIAKLKALGTGAGLLVGALVVLLFFIGVLLTLAIIGLSYVMPDWAAALVVAGVLLIVAVILGLVGYRTLMRGIPPVPTEAIESIRKDIHAVRGVGKRGGS
ncbi:phage holin family protein [Homoserinibacter sp. GY 40078]|uniref:phage holin family protein n=1 Tax=Homoserinibacter sp. GY 40078 TaxID=2603275 RepID=UPI0011C91174|nr:phage holin family protein [Homoserinibacter sp. GY 40078]TXK18824.1 phage holin family protein [Homoserinibacter sp. GY 40078]